MQNGSAMHLLGFAPQNHHVYFLHFAQKGILAANLREN